MRPLKGLKRLQVRPTAARFRLRIIRALCGKAFRRLARAKAARSSRSTFRCPRCCDNRPAWASGAIPPMACIRERPGRVGGVAALRPWPRAAPERAPREAQDETRHCAPRRRRHRHRSMTGRRRRRICRDRRPPPRRAHRLAAHAVHDRAQPGMLVGVRDRRPHVDPARSGFRTFRRLAPNGQAIMIARQPRPTGERSGSAPPASRAGTLRRIMGRIWDGASRPSPLAPCLVALTHQPGQPHPDTARRIAPLCG